MNFFFTKYSDFRGEASGFTADIMDDHSKDAKGQLISKCLFGVFNFSQKTNDEIQLYCYDTTGRLVFVLFGGNWRHQKEISKLTDL